MGKSWCKDPNKSFHYTYTSCFYKGNVKYELFVFNFEEYQLPMS